jgi:hypothetical protein
MPVIYHTSLLHSRYFPAKFASVSLLVFVGLSSSVNTQIVLIHEEGIVLLFVVYFTTLFNSDNTMTNDVLNLIDAFESEFG